jgi:GDPmannose 4,6-dehydratase
MWWARRLMHSVPDAVRLVFDTVGLNRQDHLVIDADFVRPVEVEMLCANPEGARRELGWEPRIKFEELMTMMVESDLAQLTYAQKYGKGMPQAAGS